MLNHVTGTSTLTSVLPYCLGELRQHVLVPLLGNALFSDAEQLRANHFVYECEDAARLTRWYTNVLAEITRRQAAAAHQRRQQARQATLRQLHPCRFRGYRPRPRRTTSIWAPGTSLPDRTDRHAGTFDRRLAARFQPAQSLTLAHLLTRPQR